MFGSGICADFPRPSWKRLILLPLMIAFMGCHKTFTPSSLPIEYTATPVFNAAQIDISRLRGPNALAEVVYPGDVIDVAVEPAVHGADAESSRLLIRVSANGTATLPTIGQVGIAGRTLDDAETVIRAACIQRGLFRNPAVRVGVESRNVNRVTVTGAVNNPGTHELPAVASNLRNALLIAGGLNSGADSIVEFTQSSQPHSGAPAQLDPSGLGKSSLDLAAATATGMNSPDLADGTTVFVHSKPERFIQTMGLIGNRTLPLPPNHDIRLLDALSEAGGPRFSIWVADKVKIIRTIPETGETITIKASIKKAKRNSEDNILLATRDVVSVEENVLTFTLGTINQILGIGVSAAQISAVP